MSETDLVTAIADAIAEHEPIGGGYSCSCQPLNEFEGHEWLDVDWDTHLAQVAAEVARREITGVLLEEIEKEMRWQEQQRRRSQNIDTRLSHRYAFDRMKVVGLCICARMEHWPGTWLLRKDSVLRTGGPTDATV